MLKCARNIKVWHSDLNVSRYTEVHVLTYPNIFPNSEVSRYTIHHMSDPPSKLL